MTKEQIDDHNETSVTNMDSAKTTRVKHFLLDVKEIARKYGLPFFIVTDGASMIDNSGCVAVDHARKTHATWEKENNIDPSHEWDGHGIKEVGNA